MFSGCDLFGGDDSEAPEPAAKWNPQAGLPLSEPEQLFAEDGVLEVALTAEKQTIEVSGSEIEARPWNGALIGPTLHVAPGERLEVSFDNRTKEPTNIHYHGLHVSPRGDGDNVFREFKPNTVSASTVELPEDHATGTFWYHVHFHGNTDPQVAGGLSGLLIVEGLEEKLPPNCRRSSSASSPSATSRSTRRATPSSATPPRSPRTSQRRVSSTGCSSRSSTSARVRPSSGASQTSAPTSSTASASRGMSSP